MAQVLLKYLNDMGLMQSLSTSNQDKGLLTLNNQEESDEENFYGYID